MNDKQKELLKKNDELREFIKKNPKSVEDWAYWLGRKDYAIELSPYIEKEIKR